MLKLMLDDRGQLHLDWGDEILSTCLLTHNGNVHHQNTADLMEITCAPPISERRETTEEQPDNAAGWIENDDDEELDSSGNEANDTDESETESNAAITATSTSANNIGNTEDEKLSEDNLPRDDLMKIDGIGPALQNRLFAFHILTYKKLASLDEYAIEKLERQLDDNEGLNVADWVRQAKELEGRR